jgi:hypothetical protein
MAEKQIASAKEKPPIKAGVNSLPVSEPIPVGELNLDPKNPRLTGEIYSVADQEKILKRLWNEFNVSEITDSIYASEQFWSHEPLIAALEDGKLIVIEGNRRLAAVQLLLSTQLQKKIGATGVPQISAKLAKSLAMLPVIKKPRNAVWDFIGFKHVNGPQEWDSIAKAEYVARVHEDYDVPLPEIAQAIGDRNATVVRLYHGLKCSNRLRVLMFLILPIDFISVRILHILTSGLVLVMKAFANS